MRRNIFNLYTVFLFSLLLYTSCPFSNKSDMGPGGGKGTEVPETGIPGYIVKPNDFAWTVDQGQIKISAPPGSIQAQADFKLTDISLQVVNNDLSVVKAQLAGVGSLVGTRLGKIPVQPDGSVNAQVPLTSLTNEFLTVYIPNSKDMLQVPKSVGATYGVYSDLVEPQSLVSGIYGCRPIGPGNSFSKPAVISTVGNAVSKPQVAFDGSGNAFVLWREDGEKSRLWVRHFDKTMGWAEPELIVEYASGELHPHSHLAVSPDGRAIVTWFRMTNEWGNSYISSLMNRYSPTFLSWSNPEVILGPRGTQAGSHSTTAQYDTGGIIWLAVTQNTGDDPAVFSFNENTGILELRGNLGLVSFHRFDMANNFLGVIAGWQDITTSFLGRICPMTIKGDKYFQRPQPCGPWARIPNSRAGYSLRTGTTGALLAWEGKLERNSLGDYGNIYGISFSQEQLENQPGTEDPIPTKIGSYLLTPSNGSSQTGFKMAANDDLSLAQAMFRTREKILRFLLYRNKKWSLVPPPPAIITGFVRNAHDLVMNYRGNAALIILGEYGSEYWLWTVRYKNESGWLPCDELVAKGQFAHPGANFEDVTIAMGNNEETMAVWVQNNAIHYSYNRSGN